jgi:hypothetical protein
MLSTFIVTCFDCSEEIYMEEWKLMRTMIEGVNGHSAYRYVYHVEKSCECGLPLVVEAQGMQLPGEDYVEHWLYRFFNCDGLREAILFTPTI